MNVVATKYVIISPPGLDIVISAAAESAAALAAVAAMVTVVFGMDMATALVSHRSCCRDCVLVVVKCIVESTSAVVFVLVRWTRPLKKSAFADTNGLCYTFACSRA